MNNTQTSLINIDRIINNKNPKLYKRLPKFILSWIKKIIREKELNDFLRESNGYFGIKFLHTSFDWFNVKSEVEGTEHFPDDSRIIIAANHPAGSFDGLHIIDTCYTKYGKAKALVNDLLLNVQNLNDFFMGVNKYGSTPRDYLAEISRTFESDIPVIFFPAGYVSRKKAGLIRDL